MDKVNNKKIIQIIKFQKSISSKRLFVSLKTAKEISADFLILSDLFKCDKNDINKFGVFQFKTIGNQFLEAFDALKVQAKENKIKIGFGFNLSDSFAQKEIRDNRDYIIAFFNYLKHLGAQVFFFEKANLLPKEFLDDFFKNIKGVSVFGTSINTSTTSLSDFDLYACGFNAIESLFIEETIDQYLKNRTKTLLSKLEVVLDFDAYYFKNFYRIFKRNNNKNISELTRKHNSFEISYTSFK